MCSYSLFSLSRQRSRLIALQRSIRRLTLPGIRLCQHAMRLSQRWLRLCRHQQLHHRFVQLALPPAANVHYSRQTQPAAGSPPRGSALRQYFGPLRPPLFRRPPSPVPPAEYAGSADQAPTRWHALRRRSLLPHRLSLSARCPGAPTHHRSPAAAPWRAATASPHRRTVPVAYKLPPSVYAGSGSVSSSFAACSNSGTAAARLSFSFSANPRS